ncbi:hypothetical protein F4859DRAFT_221826 [Xylaria cf. heliscus]|nr:hypothetical protein F4859DRAFT_221826 [Xylaria cf. heliscus]
MHVLTLAFVHIILVVFVEANTFTPNCSLPEGNEKPTYVSGPQIRSTLNILWSSLGTIILCTWTILHLSVPPPQEELNYRWKWWGTIHGGLKRFWRKLKWMLLALVMPEFLVGKALGDFVSAWISYHSTAMQDHARRSGIEWTLTHAYFANMGGYVLHECDDTVSPNAPHVCLCCSDDIRDEQVKREESSIKFWKWTRNFTERDRDFSLPIAIHAAQLSDLMDRGLIATLPRLSKEDIDDKSKGDVLVKFWTFLQVVWLIVELIVRKVSGLPSSQLEITALSFSACASVTYLLLLPKPKDVMIPEKIFINRPLNNGDRDIILSWQAMTFFGNALLGLDDVEPQRTMPNDIYNPGPAHGIDIPYVTYWTMRVEDYGFVLGAVVFGAIHILAWNFEFPTPVEQTLWRVASITTAIVIPFYYLVWFLVHITNSLYWASQLYNIATYVVYVIARLFIIVEVFRSLGYLPPDAFVTTWSTSIPHFG